MTENKTAPEKIDVTLNLDELTLGEMEDFEAIADVPLMAVVSERGLLFTAKVLTAVVFIVKRREDPEFTVEAAKLVRVGALDFPSSDDVEDDEGEESPSE